MAEKRRRRGDKTERCTFRMTREDMRKLEETSRKLGIPKSDVLREGINHQHQTSKFVTKK